MTCLVLLARVCDSQNLKFTHADSLKGTYGKARSWWDLKYYDLSVNFNLKDSTINGTNRISYTALESQSVMQLDLMKPMMIDSIIFQDQACKFKRDGNAYFIELPKQHLIGATFDMLVYFHGKPITAKMPPWDGGIVWTKDVFKQDWVSIACQGMAAQVWFPNKDHMEDEPDGCLLHYTVPSDLVAVGNGRIIDIKKNPNNTTTYTWKVQNPINNYCISPYIGKYSNFQDTIHGENGVLDLSYWVLNHNVSKAKQQFKQVKSILHCFEYWFGHYPFYEDDYKLVEAPYLGMEHQSAIAYGNGFENGYKKKDLSLSGWGLKWDFVIVHESGHEWFGNSISAKDVADNWIHESFTTYAENLYTEYLFGKKAGAEYVIGTRKLVMNDKPIISAYDVNEEGPIDIYYKGANMLHTIRQLVGNDSLWRNMLRGLNRKFYHQTVTSTQIENYMSEVLKMDLSPIFNQYLRTIRLPTLEYKKTKAGYAYRYKGVTSGFNMKLRVLINGTELSIEPTERWQELKSKQQGFVLDENFYVLLVQKK